MSSRSGRSRITKDPQVRREELLNIAWDLCRRQGFDTLRVEQVVQAAGVAKGTFYHYFAAKDDLLEALVQRMGDSLFAHLSAAGNTEGPAGDRLRSLMGAATSYKLTNADISYASFLYQPENLALRHRMYQAWREQARAVLLPVIEDGAADGSFSVGDPDTATDIVLMLWFDVSDQLWSRAVHAASAAEFGRIMLDGGQAIYQAQARVLGLPDNSFAVAVTPEMTTMIQSLFRSLKEQTS